MIIYSRTSLAQDTDGNLTRLTTVGPNSDSLKTYDISTQDYLERIFEQLKILNFQMSTLTEISVDEVWEE